MSQNVWATIMPFGPVTLNFLLAQKKIFWAAKGWPSFQPLDYFFLSQLNTVYKSLKKKLENLNINATSSFI
jgi:hypothetical protein